MTAWADLAAALAEAPDLPGARCAGRAPQFDYDLDDEDLDARGKRHQAAIRECRRCPALAGCRNWSDGLSEHEERVPADWVARIQGATPDEMRADAQSIKAALKDDAQFTPGAGHRGSGDLAPSTRIGTLHLDQNLTYRQ